MSTYSLKDYGDLFSRLNLSQLTVEDGDFKLQLVREALGSAADSTVAAMGSTASEDEAQVKELVSQQAELKGTQVKAPLLGVFYASNGDKKKISEGDSVKKGDVICTIEAMKMMNDVKAPVDGVVKKICVEDGALVEYDQVLFVIEE